MPGSSSVLQTPSRDYKANVLHWKTPQLPATDPSSLSLKLKWRRHKMIWTRSMRAGRSSRRKLRVCPLDDRDGIALSWACVGWLAIRGAEPPPVSVEANPIRIEAQ